MRPVNGSRECGSSFRLIDPIIVSLLFFVFLIAGRILLPYGDEPDFEWRVLDIADSDLSIFSPYYYISSLVVPAEHLQVNNSIWLILIRVFITIITVSPLFFYLLYFYIKCLRLCTLNPGAFKRQSLEYNAIVLTLLFPSVWFHIGFLSQEQFVLVLFLLASINLNNYKIIFIFILMASLIDFGNSIVFSAFYFFYILTTIALRYFWLGVVALFYSGLILGAYIYSMDVIKILEGLPVVGEKANIIVEHYTFIYDINDKYPLYLRPLITFFGLVFVLPNSQTLFWSSYVAVACVFFYLIYRATTEKTLSLSENPALSGFFASVVFFISIPMILPGYSNAKYYVFLIIFFMKFALFYFRPSSIIKFIFICNSLVLSQLFFYML